MFIFLILLESARLCTLIIFLRKLTYHSVNQAVWMVLFKDLRLMETQRFSLMSRYAFMNYLTFQLLEKLYTFYNILK